MLRGNCTHHKESCRLMIDEALTSEDVTSPILFQIRLRKPNGPQGSELNLNHRTSLLRRNRERAKLRSVVSDQTININDVAWRQEEKRDTV